jgi:hypothetical protein
MRPKNKQKIKKAMPQKNKIKMIYVRFSASFFVFCIWAGSAVVVQ